MKNIVITGSTRGIGLCMAREFLKAGCHVTLSGRTEKALEEAVKQLAGYSPRILTIPCDVRKTQDLELLWDESAKHWGSVDCWINNAGRNTPYEYVYETDKENTEAVLDTNIKGMILGSQMAAKRMLKQGGGQIWNMEGLGSNNMIQAKTVLYGTTKHALTYFTKGLAKELEGSPVLTGRLSPGMMLTDFITKTAQGEHSPVLGDDRFKKIFNILADKPETVAAFFVPRIMANMKQNAQIAWLTSSKAMMRFITAPFARRKLIE